MTNQLSCALFLLCSTSTLLGCGSSGPASPPPPVSAVTVSVVAPVVECSTDPSDEQVTSLGIRVIYDDVGLPVGLEVVVSTLSIWPAGHHLLRLPLEADCPATIVPGGEFDDIGETYLTEFELPLPDTDVRFVAVANVDLGESPVPCSELDCLNTRGGAESISETLLVSLTH